MTVVRRESRLGDTEVPAYAGMTVVRRDSRLGDIEVPAFAGTTVFRGSLIPGNGQRLEGPEGDAGLVVQLVLGGVQVQGVEALGEGLESLLALHPHQGGAQAVVDAGAKGHVRDWASE